MVETLIKKFIKDQKGEEITKHEGNFSSLVWGTACLLIYSPIISKYYKYDFGTLALLLGKKRGIGFFNFNRYKDSTTLALEKYINNTEEFTELDDFITIQKEIEEFYIKSSPEDLKKLSDEDLERLIIKSFELLRDWQVVTLFSEALDKEIVKRYFDKLNTNVDFKEFLEVSSLIDFKSFIFERDKALIEFDGKDIYDIQWIFGSYLDTPSLKKCESLAKKMIKELGEINNLRKEKEKLKKEISNNKHRVEDFKKNLSGDAGNLLDFIKIAMFIRDVRKKDAYKGITFLSNSMREMFSRKGIDKELIIYTIYRDFITGDYKKETFIEELSKRSNGFLIYFGKDGPEIEYSKFEESKKEIYETMFNSNKGIKKIKGSIANKGNAKGVVKVILNSKDFSKFKKGEILVTSMTRPEFIPLMKKSVAVITDEGGLTCHAAIVSRELGKPCVIGTKNATNVLKDNDIVEVDANNGIIKIINNF